MEGKLQPTVPCRFPAEWERHEATVLFWPARAEAYLYGSATAWRDVCDCLVRLADVVSAFERVVVFAHPPGAEEARRQLGARAEVVECPLNDAWARDAGPTIVQTAAGRLAVDWRFTGWGGRFGPCDLDEAAAKRVAAHFQLPMLRPDLACEGGAIHSNGAGTLLTTEVVLLDPGRNPGKSRDGVEAVFEEALGAERVIWLPHGYAGDDTGGHIDVIAAFAGENTVLLLQAEGEDPNRLRMEENAGVLREVAPGLEIIRVPSPPPAFAGENRLPHSYLNFYLLNGGLVLPAFGVAKDRYVADLFREVFPQHEIVPLESRPLYAGGGGIHCVTQQVPAAGA